MRHLGSLVIVVSLAAASCSDAGEGPATTPAPPPSATTTAPTSSLPTTTTPTTVAPTSTTEPPVALFPPVLVGNDDGIFLIDGEFLAQIVGDISVEQAFDDGQGNVFFQGPEDAFPYTPESTIIYVLESEALEPRDILVPTGEQFLDLLDVAANLVWYTRSEGDSPTTSTETLRHFALRSGEVTEVTVTGGWESGVVGGSAAGDLLVTYWFAEATSGFDFFDSLGNPVDVAADPYEGDHYCVDGGERYDASTGELVGTGCWEWPALSDDGRFAYIERNVDGEFTRHFLIVAETDSGEILFREELERPAGSWIIRGLDVAGDWVIVNHDGFADGDIVDFPAQIINIATGERFEAGVPGLATFVRGPIAISS